MERRPLGKTDLVVSAVGLGCGAVGGLMVRGSEVDQQRGIARALEAGITFFDTAPLYGDGASEINLGRALARLPASADAVVATKVRLVGVAPFRAEVEASLEASLRRLGRERVDVLQLHNAIGGLDPITPEVVLDDVVPAFERLRTAGKIGWYGITAVGDRLAVDAVLGAGTLHTAQVPFNLLNPSASVPVPAGFPGEDLGGRLHRAAASGIGTIVIRALAGGALSGSRWRHPIGMAKVDPIASGRSYEADVEAARLFEPLVEGGWVGSLTDAGVRFVLGASDVSTVLVGVATVDQLDAAIAAAEAGRLPPEAMELVDGAWRSMAGRSPA